MNAREENEQIEEGLLEILSMMDPEDWELHEFWHEWIRSGAREAELARELHPKKAKRVEGQSITPSDISRAERKKAAKKKGSKKVKAVFAHTDVEADLVARAEARKAKLAAKKALFDTLQVAAHLRGLGFYGDFEAPEISGYVDEVMEFMRDWRSELEEF